MTEQDDTAQPHIVDGALYLCHSDEHYCADVSPWPQPLVTIHSDLGPMVTIHLDGRLEYGEGYEPDEAARLFWAALREFAPRQFRRSTAQTIEADLARGRAAEAAVERVREELSACDDDAWMVRAGDIRAALEGDAA